jgi:hypothetical protein
MSYLSTNTDVVPKPQVAAVRINLFIQRAELVKAKSRLVVNRPAAVLVADLVVGLAAVDDAGHLGLGGNVDADVVVEPEVRAFLKDSC